tara:strand:- start:208 stop:615 length:408 start_codon:yes stop_codon:yes gene_type:complete
MNENVGRHTHLFKSVDFKSHSGLELKWKIECDALSDPEWFTISQMIMEITSPFKEAIGIPRGGTKLGNLLNQYGTGKKEDPILLVDDVLTTGKSMVDYREEMDIERWQKSCALGWVVFARIKTPKWITALFQMPI